MQLFSCSHCGHTLHFENRRCNHCGCQLGFIPERMRLLAFDMAWRPLGGEKLDEGYQPCANYLQYQSCNWMTSWHKNDPLCLACRLNHTIPDLSQPGNLKLWQRLQADKNRLIYSLLRLKLPIRDKRDSPRDGLAFDFVATPRPNFGEPGNGTGHFAGLITLDIAEGDDASREQTRKELGEPYRTVLGHLRHESGHYYWDLLMGSNQRLQAFRRVFGDERSDYADALSRHYASGAPRDWQQYYVSAYASSHPWEDWAETWAHYLHMLDTLETAWQFGLHLHPRVLDAEPLSAAPRWDPYAPPDFATLIEYWQPLTVALNSLNRSMGQGDAYPFVLSERAAAKLKRVHEVIHEATR
jgi:hypothetical protein